MANPSSKRDTAHNRRLVSRESAVFLRGGWLSVLGFSLLMLLSACDVLAGQPTPAPIFVTATPQFVIITNTPVPSATAVLAATLPRNEQGTLAITVSPTPTTKAITQTPTFTPTPTDTPATPGAVIGLVGGSSAAGGAACVSLPAGGFGAIYSGRPELATQLGCILGAGNAASVNSAYQTYERGLMVWVSSVGDTGQSAIFAIYNNGTFERFNDTWREGVDPDSVGLAPPPGLIEPIRGFGKVWREAVGVSQALGWATGQEVGGGGFTQAFERGQMINLTQTGQTYVLVSGAPGTWVGVNQPY